MSDDFCLKTAVSLGWEEDRMKHLLSVIEAGEDVPRKVIAKLLRVTTNINIPEEVRLHIADILDSKFRKVGNPGQAVKKLLPEAPELAFRKVWIQEKYKELMASGSNQTQSFDHIAKEFAHLFGKGKKRYNELIGEKLTHAQALAKLYDEELIPAYDTIKKELKPT